MKNLLLLHGALASAAQFDPFLPLLNNDFNSQAIHFTGHGGSEIPGNGYTFDHFATDILNYADQNQLDKLNIFGYSMGGYAALYFATLHPDRVNKIATLNTKFEWDEEGTAKETSLLNPTKMLEKIPAFVESLKQQHGAEHWENVVKETAIMMYGLSKHPVLKEEDYMQIEIPVLLAVGDKDKTSSIEENARVYRKLKNGQMLVFPNTPHPFDKVNPNRLADELKRFFI